MDTKELHKLLLCLRDELRTQTIQKYKRINPFVEDLTDWKGKGHLVSGKNDVTIYDSTTVVGDVEIGEHTWIGPFCSLDGTGGLKIGKYCSISAGVQIITHDTVRWALSGGKAEYEYSRVSIGDCCFIGTHAIIRRGVTIGDHCLIGANAFVNRDIPSFSIAVGVPAQVVGQVIIDGETVKLCYQRKFNG